jgi:sugar phosphate isomerase/epimerase
MCFDTGHAHMVDGAPEGIRQGLDQIRYVHFCDNHGDKDEHLMPGEATLDLDAVARALRQIDYSGTVMLEVFHPVEKLRKLIDAGFGRKLADFLETVNGR